jgi:hypothetical protein
VKAVVHSYFTSDKPIWAKIGGLSATLVKLWSELHGYEFKVHEKRVWPNVGATWGKIKILADSIRENPSEFHVFIDADIYITRPEISLSEILQGEPDADIYCGSDWVFPLNTGFVIARPRASDLLDKLSKLRAASPYGYFEQGTLQVFREICPVLAKKIHPIHFEKVNTYPPNIDEKWGGTWTTESFLCHFAGWQKERIVEYLKPAFSLNPEDARQLIIDRLIDTKERVKDE